MAGVPFRAVYNVTSIDPPELLRFMRENYPDVEWNYPRDKDGKRITMWSLIAGKTMPPTKFVRYCCQVLKESNTPNGAILMTGVRWSESTRRKETADVVRVLSKPKTSAKIADEMGIDYRMPRKSGIIFSDDNDMARKFVEHCYLSRKITINPIVDWLEEDVWEFLNDVAKVPHCRLYDEGFKRLGCIGCPLASQSNRLKEFERYPNYKNAYIKSFAKMLEHRKKRGLKNEHGWANAEEVFDWWMNG